MTEHTIRVKVDFGLTRDESVLVLLDLAESGALNVDPEWMRSRYPKLRSYRLEVLPKDEEESDVRS